MQLDKKHLLILIIISLGTISTIFSAYWYFTSVYQEDILYSDIPFQKGMSFTTWNGSLFNSTQSENEILEMKAVGIEWVAVNVWWYQKNVSSTKIYAGPWTPTPEELKEFFDTIHGHDMKILFKPMLNSEDNQWRSFIVASPEWIAEYHKFVKYWAEIAEKSSVEVFSLGCEMGNWQVHTEEIIQLIGEVRKIYSGMLTYSANHDSFWYIDWWDKVDIIGLDAYFTFTLSYDPTLYDMIEVWNGFYDNLNKFQRRWQKPIMFPELGCQNRDGCNIAPNDDKYNNNTDPEEFVMFYESLFLSKIWSAPWFKGSYWWMWDLTEITDESTANGFFPQLSYTKDILNQYYTEEREIVYPNYWAEFIMIIVLGSLITIISSLMIHKYYMLRKDAEEMKEDQKDRGEIIQDKSDSAAIKNDILYFIIISGTFLGMFLFWAFSYYNQVLFNILYGLMSGSFFADESVYVLLFFLITSLITMVFLWIFLQRLVFKRVENRIKIIIIITLTCGILIFTFETFQVNILTNEPGINYFLPFQILMILCVLLTVILTYGFPSHRFKSLEKSAKIKILYKIILGIIALSASILVGLSFLLHGYTRSPSLSIGIILILFIPLIFNYFTKKLPPQDTLNLKQKTLREKLKLSRGKLIEGIFCIYILAYYYGAMRYYDIHTLLNFNLTLLPNFFIPIGISILIGLAILCLLYSSLKSKVSIFNRKMDLEQSSKYNTILFLLMISVGFSFLALFLGWILPDFDYIIALILGGIPLAIFFIVFLIGYIDSKNIFKEEGSWRHLTFYFAFFLTLGFTANGLMIGILYALTFLTVVNGELQTETTFNSSFGYDAIQLIYNLQFLLAIGLIVISLLIFLIISKTIRKAR